MEDSKVIQLIHELGAQIGLPDLELDENRACFLTFDEVLLCIEADERFSQLTVFAPIVDLPTEGREEILLELMEANFLWNESKGATFAYSRGAQKVILQIRFDLHTFTLPDLVSGLESFIHECELWTNYFGSQEAEAPRGELGHFLMHPLV